MKLAEPVNVREILRSETSFGIDEAEQLAQAIQSGQASETRREIDSLIKEAEERSSSESLLVRAGVGAHLLGLPLQAERCLARVQHSAVGVFYHAVTLNGLERYAEAETRFADAARLGCDEVTCTLLRAGTLRGQGRLDEAEKLLRSTGIAGARRAEYSYQMGCIFADRGDTFGAIEYFERTVDIDPQHQQALFWLAGENSRHGNDADAIRLYEQALSQPPIYLGAMLNLGLLYEDMGNTAGAAFCFQQILRFDPTHSRALLYLRDIETSSVFDEETLRSEARMQHLLSRPVTDFELSVRSRNCLNAMDIATLGDLTRITEAELLEGKNFGETSLIEIRDIMAAHGLRIGQALAAPAAGPGHPPYQVDISPQEQALLARPVADLNLSVRARKCMARLGITSLGELVQRTPDELLANKNFGVTSLNEIRGQLAEFELKLRND